MDSLTHIALGACVGELVLGKKLGKKALFWGALAQTLPDIDTFAAMLYPAHQAFLVHRGITHSVLFAVIVGFCIALVVKKVHRAARLSFSLLAFFFCFQLLLHDLLDTCNSYGTGLLEPFSHDRFSVNLLYVADPFFTVSLLVAALFLLFKSAANKTRPVWALIAIGLSAFYLVVAGINKTYIDHRAEVSFQSQKISPSNYFSTPAPFNGMLWYIVADAGDNYYTGYSSIFDDAKKTVVYERHPKHYELLNKPANHRLLTDLVAFADGYYTLSQSNDTVFFNVLRFEQIRGWQHQDAAFVFSYPLSARYNQPLLLQRGRLAEWNAGTFKDYVKRIAGQQER